MSLQSEYLKGDSKLEAAALSHPAHIVPGASGDRVGKLQRVLITLEGASIDDAELRSATFGKTTTDAVIAYKDNDRRKIINRTYQDKVDPITGIMTMTSLDREMFVRQLADPDAEFIAFRQSTFRGEAIGFFGAFVDAKRPRDETVRFTRSYFDPQIMPTIDDRAVTVAHERAHTIFRANGHPGTGNNPFCVAPHLGDPNVTTSDQALANPYCFEWLIDALQPEYDPARFRGRECGS